MLVSTLKFVGYALGPVLAESYVAPHVAKFLPAEGVYGLPPAFGLVILINVVATSFVLTYLGMKVGAARKKYDVQLPNMYACEKRTDEAARRFNSIQRGHQQALETYTGFAVSSVLGGMRHPLAVSFAGVLYILARLAWARGYATGEPMARYSHSFLGKHVWTALVIPLIASISTALTLLGVVSKGV